MAVYPTGWEDLYKVAEIFLRAHYQESGLIEQRQAREGQEALQGRQLGIQEEAARTGKKQWGEKFDFEQTQAGLEEKARQKQLGMQETSLGIQERRAETATRKGIADMSMGAQRAGREREKFEYEKTTWLTPEQLQEQWEMNKKKRQAEIDNLNYRTPIGGKEQQKILDKAEADYNGLAGTLRTAASFQAFMDTLNLHNVQGVSRLGLTKDAYDYMKKEQPAALDEWIQIVATKRFLVGYDLGHLPSIKKYFDTPIPVWGTWPERAKPPRGPDFSEHFLGEKKPSTRGGMPMLPGML